MGKQFTIQEARRIGDRIGVDWNKIPIEQFRMGLGVELEHGSKLGQKTNVTNNDPIKTGRIVLSHIIEISDYYTRLKRMEDGAKRLGKSCDLLLKMAARRK